MKPTVWIPMAAVAFATSASAQTIRPSTPRAAAPFTRIMMGDEPNAARIGVYLGENGVRDTLGVLITSVVKDGPADKAGLKEGDRVAAIDGVNLKMTRDDAEDPSLQGMMNRRLTRELDKHKPGDDVELHVVSGSSVKTVRIKTVAARDLEAQSEPAPAASRLQAFRSDRAALGINLGGSTTKRDTLGVFVAAVTPDGPAEKAGIVEGDRIARINGTDLRVPASDAGDGELSRARISRLNREIGQLKAGDVATLTVVSGGRTREVKVTAIKASELPHDANTFFFGDGAFTMPNIQFPEFKQLMPGGMRMFEMPNGGGSYYFRNDGGKMSEDIREQVERAMEKARTAIDAARGVHRKIRSRRDVADPVQELDMRGAKSDN